MFVCSGIEGEVSKVEEYRGFQFHDLVTVDRREESGLVIFRRDATLQVTSQASLTERVYEEEGLMRVTRAKLDSDLKHRIDEILDGPGFEGKVRAALEYWLRLDR